MHVPFYRIVARLMAGMLAFLLFFTAVRPVPAVSESAPEAGVTAETEEAWMQIVLDNDYRLWADYAQLRSPNGYFTVLMMPGNVLAILEPLHEQLAICYMIIGLDMILLLDTCTGILDLSEVVDYYSIYDVTVLNSHDHFDHIGGNSQFDEVWCYDLPSAVRHLTNGPTETEQAEILGIGKSVQPVIRAFGYEIPEKIPGKAPTGTVKDGQIIDLGGRELEVIHTPGHQPSCIMLLDRANKLLFTGDMFYPGPMYCMFDDSSFPDYVKSMRKVADLVREVGIEKVYTSHNAPAADAKTLCRFADFLEGIEKGEITEYETDEDGFREYWMDDVISITLPGEGTEPVTGYSMPDPE
jgi:glyoxylase-like metal-dependent hydrolase (beta-lactamase superfamily II)